MDELIARLEAAAEGSAYLDMCIADVVPVITVNAYTRSIDAALLLVPEGWFIKLRCGKPVGAEGEFCHCELDCDADSIGRDLDDDEPMDAKALNAPTLPLAICIASLRARSHTAPQEK